MPELSGNGDSMGTMPQEGGGAGQSAIRTGAEMTPLSKDGVEEEKGRGEGNDENGCRTEGVRDYEKKDQKKVEEPVVIVEQPLLTIKEVFVYRVPPLRAASGHRAEEWNLAKPAFTGIVKVAQVDDACCIRLFKPPPEGELGAETTLFAECAIRLTAGRTLPSYVEPVMDSSRYFVLRCEDPASGRHAYVGIGFRERSTAFDLKAVLDEFVRFMDRQKQAERNSSTVWGVHTDGDEEEEEGVDGMAKGGVVKQMKDMSIHEGQKIHIDLKVAGDASSNTRRHRPSSPTDKARRGKVFGGLGGGGMLAPPPPPGTLFKSTVGAATQEQEGWENVAMSEVGVVEDGRVDVKEDRVCEGEGGGGGELGQETEASGVEGEGEGEGGEMGGGEEDDWGEFESA